MVPKHVFTGGGFKAPPPNLMSIPEAPTCKVKLSLSFDGTPLPYLMTVSMDVKQLHVFSLFHCQKIHCVNAKSEINVKKRPRN